MLKSKEQKLIKVKAPFIDEISGLAITKILEGSTYSTMLLKLKFMHNAATLDIVNNGPVEHERLNSTNNKSRKCSNFSSIKTSYECRS